MRRRTIRERPPSRRCGIQSRRSTLAKNSVTRQCTVGVTLEIQSRFILDMMDRSIIT
jgi:hypothetical protein